MNLSLLCCMTAAGKAANAGPSAAREDDDRGPEASWQGSADADLFRRQGYLVIRGFASRAEVVSLRSAIEGMLDSWEPATRRASTGHVDEGIDASVSSLRNPGFAEGGSGEPNHAFLLASAARASVFLERRAADAVSGAFPARVSKRHLVRKVAHGLHLGEGPFRDFVLSPKVARLTAELGWQQPVVAQTVYRFGLPLSAGVDRHQDSATLYTEPPSCLGIWLALEDANKANGCLRVRTGSHHEPIRERLVRRQGYSDSGVSLVFERLANASPAAPDSDFLHLETASGDLVVMHGALEHFSSAGVDPSRSRESLQLHIVEAGARWALDNWLQYPPGLKFMPLTALSRTEL